VHFEDGRTCALVLVGRVPADGEVAATIDRLGLGDRVVVTGYVPDADVAALIGNAVVFAFPSRYEGFGLPVLEAQLLGVPVVASNAASIPEVAGDGALLFDPRSVAEIVSALATTLGEADVRADLVRRGRTNAARFSWERAARATREVYRESFVGSPGAA
ncbi:MAG: glycosyltransferase family 4 protein, partial [Acidimicrobiia bacterium]|nr:glycosyltransferase family 4 protein [Acidimicrobiia bacterium]